jgi:hypothetical protein
MSQSSYKQRHFNSKSTNDNLKHVSGLALILYFNGHMKMEVGLNISLLTKV